MHALHISQDRAETAPPRPDFQVAVSWLPPPPARQHTWLRSAVPESVFGPPSHRWCRCVHTSPAPHVCSSVSFRTSGLYTCRSPQLWHSEIGRASCRDRGEIAGSGGAL